MEPSLPSPVRPEEEPAGGGELIVLNGRLEGLRRPLGMPLTLVGRAAGCEVRLTGDGVQAHHCVLVRGEAGLVLRDLQTKSGTFVNGQRVTHATLQDGD